MKEIYVNPNWTFKETVEHLKTLKTQYEEILASFSCFELRKEVNFKVHTKRQFYSLKFEEWKRDKLWNYMNGYEFLYVIKNIADRCKQTIALFYVTIYAELEKIIILSLL